MQGLDQWVEPIGSLSEFEPYDIIYFYFLAPWFDFRDCFFDMQVEPAFSSNEGVCTHIRYPIFGIHMNNQNYLNSNSNIHPGTHNIRKYVHRNGINNNSLDCEDDPMEWPVDLESYDPLVTEEGPWSGPPADQY